MVCDSTLCNVAHRSYFSRSRVFSISSHSRLILIAWSVSCSETISRPVSLKPSDKRKPTTTFYSLERHKRNFAVLAKADTLKCICWVGETLPNLKCATSRVGTGKSGCDACRLHLLLFRERLKTNFWPRGEPTVSHLTCLKSQTR